MSKKRQLMKQVYEMWLADPRRLSAVAFAFDMLRDYPDLPPLTAERYGRAWEAVVTLADDFDDDAWTDLEYQLRRLELITEPADIWVHYPSNHYDEPPWDDVNEDLLEKTYNEYKVMLIKELYDVIE